MMKRNYLGTFCAVAGALMASMLTIDAHAATTVVSSVLNHADILGALSDHGLGLAGLGAAGTVASMARKSGTGGDPSPEQVMEQVTAELKRIGDEVKKSGELALKEAKSAGEVSAETKEAVDKLLVKQGELQARLDDAEKKLLRRGSNDPEGAKSVGSEFVESEGYKAYVAEGNYKKGFSHQVKAVVTITSDPAVAGDTIAPDRLPGIQTPPQRRLTVRDLLTPGRTASNLIQYVKETGFQNMAATVAEGAKKPQSDLTFDLLAQAVVKIAHFVKASTEILADAPMMQSYIDGRLRYGLAFKEEAQLLNGSGVGNNLNGIYTQATAYVAPITIANPTRIDVLRLALLQAELAEYPSTGIVLHPSDWAAIELTKDTTGAYIFANPQGIAQPALWGRPVVATQAMTVDTFLTGAFKLGAQIFDRQQASVMVATENEDDFVKNIVTILIEERLGLAVYRPEAFVKGDITPA
ncbi:Phage major capsid protein [Cupriavidus sp. U2]|nr:Phage major capsid protein [Cupriavidus sp. U2]